MAKDSNQPISTLEFSVNAEKTIVTDTIKLIAHITGLVSVTTTEDAFRSEIRATVKSLIDTDWQFTNLVRTADDSGFEKVTVTATARVSENENYNLVNRARAASRQGLTITEVEVDTTIPASKIEEAERELRADILQKVLGECAGINALNIGEYRVGRIQFGTTKNAYSQNILATAAKVSYGSGFATDDTTLGNASKISIVANVSLVSFSE